VPGRWEKLPDRIATVLVLALLLARPLFPSEDADTGSGLIVVSLWCFAGVLWAASQARTGRLLWYGTWFDLGPLILFAAIVCSAFLCDSPRSAINMASEWAGLVLCYFLVRQLVRSPESLRVLVCAMLGLALALSAHGLYQVFWGLDSLREEYARDRVAILHRLEIEPGSPQEDAFRNRLNSHEPFATFALANSLAGFLLAWLPSTMAWWLHCVLPSGSTAHRWQHVIRVIAASFALATVLLCLILSQSRTAYVGALIQFLFFCILFARTVAGRLVQQIGLPRVVLMIAGAVVLIGGVIGVAWSRGKIDEMLVTQATRSLQFRVQYWRATLGVIAEQPWSGTGPGNFRGHYLKHKLPESSEEIADPHNMVLEVIATSGLVAGAALIVTLVATISTMLFRPRVAVLPQTWHGSSDLWLGGIAAFIISESLSGLDPWIYICLFGAWMLASGTIWRLSLGSIDSRVLAVSAIGLVIHLLGAGGISMPGVAQSLWTLLALGVNVSDDQRALHGVESRIGSRVLLIGALGAWVLFITLVLRPVTMSTASVLAGRSRRDMGDLGGAESEFRRAAAQDRLWAEPWMELSRTHYERWRASRGRAAGEHFSEAVAMLENARRLAPDQLEPVLRLAQLYEARAESTGSNWDKAAYLYGQCVERYPNNAGLHARLARARGEDGDLDGAKMAAARAIQLDSQTAHADHKLTPAERRLLEPLQAHRAPVE
jgi:hypothetical protein